MNPWNTYHARHALHGETSRDREKYNLMNRLSRQIPSTLSYHNVDIDGEDRNIVILNSDNLNQKTLCSLPGEDIRHGAYIDWMNHKWLVTERDANSEIYTKCIMLQCNYLLRWINDSGEIIERWSIVEDGTRYLTGEFSDSFLVATKGDSRIAVTLPKDLETLALDRDARFIIDDYSSPHPLAYRLTKPFKLGGSYDENGVIIFVMTECNTENDDNIELHIADYYKHFPREGENNSSVDISVDDLDSGRRGWI
jgi:hypothetical protein